MRRRLSRSIVAGVIASAVLAVAAVPAGAAIQLVTHSATNTFANGDTSNVTISANGGRVAFGTLATNLGAPNTGDVLVWTAASDTLIEGSLTNLGNAPDRGAIAPFISGDGTHVLFQTGSTNMVPEVPDHLDAHVYLTPIGAPGTRLVTHKTNGDPVESTVASHEGALSLDGQSATYESSDENILTPPTPTYRACTRRAP